MLRQSAFVVSFLFLIIGFFSSAEAGKNVRLFDADGNPLNPNGIDAASVKQSCGKSGCHDVDKSARSLHYNKPEDADPEYSDCFSCHLPKGKVAFNKDGTIKKVQTEIGPESCKSCHSDESKDILKGVHGKNDKAVGDHPTCMSCHGSNPHEIIPTSRLTRIQKAAMCSGCHSNKELALKYGMSSDSVSSYEESFHGKALLRFGKNDSATCSDCHSHHKILSSKDSASPIHRNNAASTCCKCHIGAQMNFAMSGANHLRIKMQDSLFLRLVALFFRVLTIGTLCFLMGFIAIDLRRKVFSRNYYPSCGRLVGLFITFSFLSMICGLVLGTLRVRGAEWAWLVSIALMLIAFVLFLARKKTKKTNESRIYRRFDISQRIQHICLALSFTILVITGMPLRYAEVEWSHYLHFLFGGFDGARIAHRAAAVLLVTTWIWHGFYLIYLWKKAGWSFKSWTMWPARKDFSDIFETIKFGLGLQSRMPKFAKFNFKEKFDYFAVYWGMPIMVFSGFVLWFPVFLGNKLPELALSVAYIAHSDEALLAMLAIMIWHLYNTHFNPDHFPMNPVWYTGVLTQEQMEEEHSLEKERIDASNSSEAITKTKQKSNIEN